MAEALDDKQAAVALDLRVRFAETDQMGIVHHSNYLIWFEAGRVAWMDAAGMPYAEVAAGGNHFAVTSVQVEHRAPARFGDVVRITTWISLLRSRQVRFDYLVQNAADGAVLATGRTEHICVDLAGRMAKIPQQVMERLSEGMAQLMALRTAPLVMS
jgi:acyl-CoA thioester hydrolase